MPELVRVGIVHPGRLFREALACSLARDVRIKVVAHAGDSGELCSVLEGLAIDVVAVDLGLPERAGLAHAQAINEASPRAAIVMMGVGDVDDDILAVCEAGATAFVHQNASLDELLGQVLAVARGEMACSPRVAALLTSRLRQRVRHLQKLQTFSGARLTRRELEVIDLIDCRFSNKEIATQLHIEVQTVKNHVHNILEKLGLRGRYAVARYARENGILSAVSHTRGPSRSVAGTREPA